MRQQSIYTPDYINFNSEKLFLGKGKNSQRYDVLKYPFFDTMADADVKELNLIIKADVQGSIEALQDSLDKMDQSEVRINTIHSAVGAITETVAIRQHIYTI